MAHRDFARWITAFVAFMLVVVMTDTASDAPKVSLGYAVLLVTLLIAVLMRPDKFGLSGWGVAVTAERGGHIEKDPSGEERRRP